MIIIVVGVICLVIVVYLSFKLGRGWEVKSISRELQEKGVSERPYGDFDKYTIKIVGSAEQY